MKIVSLSCPKCGGKLKDIKIADGKSDMFCNYCGNHILLEDENHQVFEHRTVDAARIRELELEAEKYRNELAGKEKMRHYGVLGIKYSLPLLVISIILVSILKDDDSPIYFLVLIFGGILMVSGITLFAAIAPDSNDKTETSD